mmetsp:Transcript_21456/g.46506  ORF Transcript_21456/g.46506 Transcript_21456/m.46506 type:complete len:216 (-) Transcript_21456:75-722(-)
MPPRTAVAKRKMPTFIFKTNNRPAARDPPFFVRSPSALVNGGRPCPTRNVKSTKPRRNWKRPSIGKRWTTIIATWSRCNNNICPTTMERMVVACRCWIIAARRHPARARNRPICPNDPCPLTISFSNTKRTRLCRPSARANPRPTFACPTRPRPPKKRGRRANARRPPSFKPWPVALASGGRRSIPTNARFFRTRPNWKPRPTVKRWRITTRICS